MSRHKTKIGIVATGRGIDVALAAKVKAVAEAAQGGKVDLYFHPQCFLSAGHFAGPDSGRAQAFLDIANDPSFDALWFARGGYGSCRIAEEVMSALTPTARDKIYLGYSDAGTLLAGLYSRGFPRLAHGPMPIDIIRDGGEAALKRALSFLVDHDTTGFELSVSGEAKTAAFNITILNHILGTQLQPDLADHVLMLEEVGEYMYRIDRSLFHITSNAAVRRVKGIMLGRCSDIPVNDPDFGKGEEEIVRHWCSRSGIRYLGRADIGHDVSNRIVPFGRWQR